MKITLVRYVKGQDQPFEQLELKDFDPLRDDGIRIFSAEHGDIVEFVEIDVELDEVDPLALILGAMANAPRAAAVEEVK